MNTLDLIAGYDTNGILGALSGILGPEADRLFREEHQAIQAALGAAREQARGAGAPVTIDAARLSGTIGFDSWVVAPDGATRRELTTFPDLVAQLSAPAAAPGDQPPCRSLEAARPLLLRCAYNGLWSPSGTNWQPIRALELEPAEAGRLTGRLDACCGLLVFARARYDSILGDVARLCGLEPAPRAEDIDLGTWIFVAEQTARAHGWALEAIDLRREASLAQQARGVAIDLLRSRTFAAGAELLASVERGDHIPATLLLARQGPPLGRDPAAPGSLARSRWDQLVEARSTQRVASPVRDLPREALLELWEAAGRFLPAEARTRLALPTFTWHEETPRLIGVAMHAGIEGGEAAGGLVQRANLEQVRDYLRRCGPLPEEWRRWVDLPRDCLEEPAGKLPLPAHLIPEHLRRKLVEGGQFKLRDDLLLDQRDRPLTAERMIKLVRMIAKSFGRFFLSFQNTHPLLGVLLCRASPEDPSRASAWLFEQAGRAVAHMSFLARAKGLVSIIKSGPVEIARAALTCIVTEHAPDPAIRQALAAGLLSPLLTFQIGYPLGPEEIVSAGQPDAHPGLAERLLDRRAVRARLSAHYVPALR
jgi:hypothetical protein